MPGKRTGRRRTSRQVPIEDAAEVASRYLTGLRRPEPPRHIEIDPEAGSLSDPALSAGITEQVIYQSLERSHPEAVGSRALRDDAAARRSRRNASAKGARPKPRLGRR